MATSIAKHDWVSSFTLVGKPVITDYTFKIDERSTKSSWIYNSMNMGVDCGERYGTVYVEMMGGYSDERDSFIYVHGKDDDGRDDFSTRFTVDWDDRFNEEILDTIGDLCFVTVGLEKTDKDKTYYKRFLSEYDAIEYIKEHITDDMVVNVRGNLEYSTYNGNTQVRKRLTSIALSRVEDPADYRAVFTQSILIDKDSANLKNIDKDKGVMYVDARVLDYVKEYNGVEVKGQFPFVKQFEFPMPLDNQAQCKKIMDKVFKVKKGVTQITFEGDFIEGGAVVQATMDDIPDEIKDLIGVVYTEEEALAECSSNGSRERRMVLRKPLIRLVGDDKKPVLQRFDERYEESDLILDCMTFTDEGDDDLPFGNSESVEDGSTGDDDMSWLDNL